MKIRLDRFLAKASLGSRRETLKLIKSGKISVNGITVKDPSLKIDPERDEILIGNREVKISIDYHYKFYKPKGFITSHKDPQRTIFDLLPKDLPGLRDLSPAGRLDKDAEGLILLTTDGELAHRITHPKWKLPKIYEIILDKGLLEEDRSRIERGIPLKEGMTRPASVKILNRERTHVEITVIEGRYHLLKRLFGALGYRVMKLKRLAIGPLKLENLNPGEVRPLTGVEISALKKELNLGEYQPKSCTT
ncbi:MAG: rRNA pseudouridine synthase [Caldimicrobium sp.]|nr:rRNA pseudouridine synthase [Caldimicrobium sp.]MCX7612871.1 rRNA pseudouridine synthase [Caldimicrobium sp.]MDW8183601.1 pseudouridine synthase [Caldimicrobium sp.]